MYSHHDGEVWVLCTSNEGKFFTAGDDNKLLLYDIKLRKIVAKGTVEI